MPNTIKSSNTEYNFKTIKANNIFNSNNTVFQTNQNNHIVYFNNQNNNIYNPIKLIRNKSIMSIQDFIDLKNLSLFNFNNININFFNFDVINIDELLEKMPDLRKLNEDENLQKFYDKNYIQKKMNFISSNYSGREASVLSAIYLIKLAGDKGVKLDYDYGGGHTKDRKIDIETVLDGIDCSSFASYIINQGAKNKIPVMITTDFRDTLQNKIIDYDKAKPGDIINSDNHVEIIIENDINNRKFITAEAASSKEGVRLNSVPYSYCLSKKLYAYDLTGIYDQ